MYYSTADLCDQNKDKNIQILSSEFKSYGGLRNFCGQVITLKLDKGNSDLINILKNEDGKNKIIVIDVDKEYYGLVDYQLLLIAQKNNYKAIIINGYVRKVDEIKKTSLGVFALGTCPLTNFENNKGERGIELIFGGVTFNDGDFVYADKDGIIFCSQELDKSNLKVRY